VLAAIVFAYLQVEYVAVGADAHWSCEYMELVVGLQCRGSFDTGYSRVYGASHNLSPFRLVLAMVIMVKCIAYTTVHQLQSQSNLVCKTVSFSVSTIYHYKPKCSAIFWQNATSLTQVADNAGKATPIDARKKQPRAQVHKKVPKLNPRNPAVHMRRFPFANHAIPNPETS
jgi:hypothetical protein